MSLWDDALAVASELHKGQKRRDGSDYISHLLSVVNILKTAGFIDEELLVAAILHDVCEDTKLSNLELSNRFGERVGHVVNSLSKNRKPQYEEGPVVESKISSFGKFSYRFWLYINRFALGAMDDHYIMFIKMADQIDNLSTMEHFSEVKKRRKIDEVEECFIPIYDKIGKKIKAPYLQSFLLLRQRLESVLDNLRSDDDLVI